METLLALISSYGAPFLFVATFLSCLAVPIPTGLFMLGAGAFVASGDMTFWEVVASAWGGAILGDQAGFAIGRLGGDRVVTLVGRSAIRKGLLDRTRSFMASWGGAGVFLSRWLVSPLGPYLNVIGGATGFDHVRFTLWGVLGETVWVTIYLGLGYAFSGSVELLADLLGNAVGLIAMLVVAGLLGAVLFHQSGSQG